MAITTDRPLSVSVSVMWACRGMLEAKSLVLLAPAPAGQPEKFGT